MDEKPFKFKKAAIKLVGGFNILSKNEFDLLCKDGFMTDKSFLHIRKLWNVVETNDEVDEEGVVITPGVKAKPAFVIITGIIKDDKFIATRTQNYSDAGFNDIHKVYSNLLQNYLEQGWKKHQGLYDMDDCVENPIYRGYVGSDVDISANDINSISPRSATTKVGTFNSINTITPLSSIINTPKEQQKPGIFKKILKRINL